MNKSIILLLIMTFSSLFGDDNVVVRHGDQQVAQGEFIGTYMNHVHILMGDKIIYYACDDIVSITSSSEGFSYGNEFDYDCSKNTVTADILFPPELDPMTGEWTQMLPDVFNPDIPKPAVQKKVSATPVVQKPAAKVEVGSVSATEDFVVIDGVKYARVQFDSETGEQIAVAEEKQKMSYDEIVFQAKNAAWSRHNGAIYNAAGIASCFIYPVGLPVAILYTESGIASNMNPYDPVYIDLDPVQKNQYRQAYKKEEKQLRRKSIYGAEGFCVGLVCLVVFVDIISMGM